MDLGLVQLEHTDPVGSARHFPSVECSHQRHPGDPRLPPLRPLPCWPLPCGSPAGALPTRCALRPPGPCSCLEAVLGQGTGGAAGGLGVVLLRAGRSQGPGTGDRSLAPASPSHVFSASPAFAILSFVGHTDAFLLYSA